MSHYFINDDSVKSVPADCIFKFDDTSEYDFNTDRGVFSYCRVDENSAILLDTMYADFKSRADFQRRHNFLDLGCGYGFIGIIWQHQFPNSRVVMSDVNERGVALAKENAALNLVAPEIFVYDGVPDKYEYDIIALNPPIHAGKKVIYRLYAESAGALSKNEDSAFYVVINKKHGAESTKKELERLFQSVTAVFKKHGILVYKAQNSR